MLKLWVTRHEGHVVAVEHLDQLREIHQRARQAVDLVDHHHVDQPVLDVGQEPLQGRAVQRAAGDAAIVILVAHQHPALGALAGDVGLAGLALGVEAVELLLEAFLGGFAGVDGAAQLAGGRFVHARLPDFSPKKASPFHCVPVMARAMADSDL